MKNPLPLAVFLTSACPLRAQKPLPLIRANTLYADIWENTQLRKNVWRIVPEKNPDIYKTCAKNVTFLTDIDFISFKIASKSIYNFIIAVGGKDSTHTQIRYEPPYLDKLKKPKNIIFPNTGLYPRSPNNLWITLI